MHSNFFDINANVKVILKWNSRCAFQSHQNHRFITLGTRYNYIYHFIWKRSDYSKIPDDCQVTFQNEEPDCFLIDEWEFEREKKDKFWPALMLLQTVVIMPCTRAGGRRGYRELLQPFRDTCPYPVHWLKQSSYLAAELNVNEK